jgi:hypothetical protein
MSIWARLGSSRYSLANSTWAIRRWSDVFSRAERRHLRRLLIEPLEDKVLLSSQAIPDVPAMTSSLSSWPISSAVPLGGGTSSPAGLIPSQIRQAYGYNFVNFADGSSADGSKQTIAIVDAYHDPNIRSDLHAFDQKFGLSDPVLTIIDPDGVPPSPPPPDSRGFSWGLETALDVEWAHALAPGAAILLVETPGTDFGLLSGVNHARSEPGVSVVSMSWGENTVINDAVFTTPAGHQGVTFVAGSGDAGSQADYPAFSSNVLAVGGTKFVGALDAQGDYPGEVAWQSGGGGVDPTETQPAAQLQAVGALGGRAIPDVSFDAGSDVSVFDSYDDSALPWITLEGTSFGAPAWAALIAIVDQGRALVGAGSLDGSSQTIPELYTIARSKAYSSAFHDITSGSNDAYNATPGYDLVTGLGTPNVPLIVAFLSHNLPGLHLIVPGAGAVVTTTTPTFQWTPALGAISYNLTVIDTVTGVTVISQQNLATTSYTAPGTTLTSGDTYSWTVSAVTGDGQAAPALPALPFAVIPVPGPTGPSGITDLDTPTFSWSAVPGAAGYNVEVFDTTSGATAINTQVSSKNSFTPSTPLNNLDTYEWTVSAYISPTYNGLPYASPPSGAVYFTVKQETSPVLNQPANQGAVTTTLPTFEWSSIPLALYYGIEIRDLDNPPVVVAGSSNVPGTSFTPAAPLLLNHAYTWHVRAFTMKNGVATASPFSDPFYFSVSTVGNPTLISPSPGETITTATPTLRWSAVPGGSNNVYVSLFDVTGASAVLTDLPVRGTSLALSVPLANGHTYEWFVSPTAAPGPAGVTSDFTVSLPRGGSQSLPKPVPIGPSGLVTTSNVTLQWKDVPGATSYAVFLVDVGEGGTSAVFPELTSLNSYTIGLSNGAVYLWSVTAYDGAGNDSAPSTPLDFKIAVPVSGQLPAPSGLSPSGTISSAAPTLSWSPVAGALNSYFLYMVDVTSGTTILSASTIDPYTIGNNGGGAPLAEGHTYRWYLSAHNSSGEGSTAVQTFTVSGTPITAPAQLAPSGGSTVSTTTPTFGWSAVSGATGYLVYIIDPTVETLAFAINSPTNAYTLSGSIPNLGALMDGRTYEWQVNAVVSSGSTTTLGPVSAAAEFTVSFPGIATLESPAAGSVVKTDIPTFQWLPVAGASGYNLYLEDTTTGTVVLPEFPVITTSYTLGAPLANGDAYQWYVRAFDNFGNVGLAPPALNFSVSVPPPVPVVPVLLGPIATITGATPTFTWTAVPAAVAYALFIEIKSTGNIVAAGSHVYGLTYTPSSSLPGGDTTYDWYVQAIYSDGTLGPKPPDADFDVSTTPALPTAPAPISPSGSITATTPTFTWSPVTGAQGYELQIFDTTNAKDVPVLLSPQVSSSTSAVLSVALASGRTYQWQVMAYGNPGSLSPASNLVSFSIHALPPPAPPHVTGVSVTSRVGKKIKAITVHFDEALVGVGPSSATFFQLSQRKKGGKHPVYRPINDGPISYNSAGYTVRVQLRKPVIGPIRIIVLGGIQAANGTLSVPSSPVTRS